jgi:cytochrome c oxidase subunit I+III
MSGTVKPERPLLDVSELPTVVFGPRASLWWGTLMFMLIEGTALAVCAFTYFYLRRNFQSWPPEGTPYPALLVPTAGAIFDLLTIIPAYLGARAAKRLDVGAVRRWLIVLSICILGMSAFRAFEFAALNVHWDTNAYGSILWTTLGFHATLILMEVYEVIGLAVLFLTRDPHARYFSDVSDIAFYWYFLVLSWIPLYFIVFPGPYLF